MCVLCGEALSHVHWTDVPLAVGEKAQGADSPSRTCHRRQRMKRLRLMKPILVHYGLTMEDWAGSRYVVRDKKGRSCSANDLEGIWQAVKALSGRCPDPLDPSLLSRIAAIGEGKGSDRG